MGSSKIDLIAQKFVNAWQDVAHGSGSPPDLKTIVDQADESIRAQLLAKLLPVELASRSRSGFQPVSADYLGHFPDDRDIITAAFNEFRLTEATLAPAASSKQADRSLDGGLPDKNRLPAGSANEATAIFSSSDKSAVATPSASRLKRGQRFGDYEIIEEIARGGMGVVFKARQTKLDRECALKMILAGQLASDQEVQRFYAEAQSAANLEHSGIVPIYEIGELDGQHFFSMKYVEGGSLEQQLEVLRSDTRQSVTMIESVARAVHHAHQRGILHRDLKPANILLDAEGNPLVSDLGLAKNTKIDSGMTRTGAIVGTPSFMPPEQAAGKSDLTVAVDIYSLGAILYQMLTGVPPFKGETPMDTILKVLHETPVPPRDIDRAVDRDLELICMKCLERHPEDRYSTANALADDLRNWLENKPISLRPPSAANIVTDWLKHNLRSVAGAALVGLVFGLILGVTLWLSLTEDSFGHFYRVYDRLPNEPRPILAFEVSLWEWIGDNMQWVIFPPIAFVGLFTALITRPDGRKASIALGTVSGLTMSLVAFASGIGWAPLVQFTAGNNMDDIYLLGSAAANDEATRSRAQRALGRKYPDLANYPVDEWGNIVANKTIADGTANIPVALWLSMLATLVCCMIPALLGTVLGGSLMNGQRKAWWVVLLYLEVAGLVALILIFIAMNYLAKTMGANIIVPPPAWQLGMFISAGVAIWIAITGRNWKWRLAGHAFWITALVLYSVEVHRTGQTFEIANQLIAERKFEDAAVRYERLASNKPNDIDALFFAAVVQAKLGNLQQYRAHCREMTSRFERTSVPEVADRTAKVCLLKPNSLDDMTIAYRLAEVAVIEGSGTEIEDYFMLLRGLSDYRQGEFEGVAKWLEQPRNSWYKTVPELAGLIGSMATFQISASTENTLELNHAIKVAREWIDGFEPTDVNRYWTVDWLILQIITEEAENLIRDN